MSDKILEHYNSDIEEIEDVERNGEKCHLVLRFEVFQSESRDISVKIGFSNLVDLNSPELVGLPELFKSSLESYLKVRENEKQEAH